MLFERVDIGVTEFPTKTAKTELKKFGLRFFFISGRAHPVFKVEIFIFLAAEKITLGGGGRNFKTG